MALLHKILIALTLALSIAAAGITASAAGPVWEELNNPSPAVVQSLENVDQTFDFTIREGYIYVRTSQPLNIKIFSILGQQISQETLRPGTHRIRLASRGIYILRAGTTTRRITI